MITWYNEDDEWLGFMLNCDDPHLLVKQPEPGIWAGWVYDVHGNWTCVTHDHTTSHEARREIELLQCS